jgi:hypothetical protein
VRRWIILATCAFLWALGGWSAQTLIQREMFYGPGAYTSDSPGTNFYSVAGPLYLKAGGPRLAGDNMGWSADGQVSASFATAIMHIPSAPVSSVGAWVFVKALHSDAESVPQLIWLSPSDVYQTFSYSIYHNQLCASRQYGANVSITDVRDVTYQWVWLQIAASNNAGSITVRFYYRLPGGTMTNWYTLTEAGGATQTTAGFQPSWGQYGSLNGRIGAACTFTNKVLEAEYPADLLEPATAGMNWYVDSVNGSDTNSGASPSAAWLTAGKITQESSSCGLFPATNWQSGNELIIDTPAPLFVNGSTLHLRTPGLSIHAPTNGSWILARGDKVLTNWAFTKTANYANTWQTADTTNNITVWEDEKWMNHPTGASWAAVANSVDTVPGSFWTDGTTLYVHPFGDTSPTNDGKAYTRSISPAAMVELDAPNMRLADLRAGKNVDCSGTSNKRRGINAGLGLMFHGFCASC